VRRASRAPVRGMRGRTTADGEVLPRVCCALGSQASGCSARPAHLHAPAPGREDPHLARRARGRAQAGDGLRDVQDRVATEPA